MVWLAMMMATAAPLDTWLGTAPLQADPSLIQQLAEDADEEADPAILAEHVRYEWSEDGTLHERMHRVYLVRSEETADSWGYVTGSWAPWHEDTVVLRARVISPTGRVTELDPDSVVEESRETAGATTYSDGRTRNAPLPAMVPGVIVEEVIEWTRHPLLPGVPDNAWTTGWFNVDHPGRIATYLAPRGTELSIAIRGDGVEKKNHREEGARGFRLQFAPYDTEAILHSAWPDGTYGLASAVVSLPVTWQSITEEYARQVEPIVEGADVSELVSEVRSETSDPDEQVNRVAQRVRDDIRYVALELGENAIIPHAPSDVMADGFGDCKDKATVLIAALRELGHEAWLTLINTGPGMDVEPRVPNLGGFNHAIVAMAQSDGSLRFIDPTADVVPVTELPFEDQGRSVLVIRPGTTGLVDTPMGGADDHVWDHTYDVTFSEAGYPAVTEITRALGRYAADARDADPLPERRRIQEYADWGTERAGTDVEVLALEVIGDDARTPEYTRRIEWDQMAVGESTGTNAMMPLTFADDVVWALPDPVLSEDDDDWSLADRPFGVRIDPFSSTTTWRASVPEGFVVRYAPTSEAHTWGPVSYERTVTSEDDTVTVQVVMKSDAAVMEVDDAVALRDWAFDELRSERWQVAWTDAATQLADLGRPYESIGMLAKRFQRDPERAYTGTALSAALLDAGFTQAARRVAATVSDNDPEVAAAWRLLAMTHMRNDSGSIDSSAWDPEKVYEYLDRSLELEESSQLALKMRALFAMIVFEGERQGVEQAMEDFTALRELGIAEDDSTLLGELLKTESFDDLRSYAAGRQEQTWQVGAVSAGWAQTGDLGPYDSVPIRLSVAGQFLAAEDVERATRVVEGIEPSAAGQGADLVRQLHGLDRPLNPRRHPEDAFRAYAASITSGERDADLISRDASEDYGELAFPEEGLAGLPLTVATYLLSRSPMMAEGNDDVGYRVRGDLDAMRGTLGFVVKERGSYRILADGGELNVLAERALAHALAGEEDAARQWLTWIFESSPDAATRNEPVDTLPATYLWNHGQAEDLALVAAAALAYEDEVPETVITTLENALQSADEDDATSIRFALSTAYLTNEDEQASYQTMVDIFEAHPSQPYVQGFLLALSADTGDQLDAVSRVRAQGTLDPSVTSSVAMTLTRLGEEEGLQMLQRQATSPGASPYTRNNYAWYLATMHPDRAEEALRLMRDGAGTREATASDLHTQAALELMVGEAERAYTSHLRAVQQLEGAQELGDAWAIVRAQLLANWGLFDQARLELDSYEVADDDQDMIVWVERTREAIEATEKEASETL